MPPPAPAVPPSRALVFPCNHPRAVAVIRSLGRAGLEVVAVDPGSSATGMHSRHAAHKVRIDPDPDALLAFLEASPLARGAMLFPTDDDALARVARHADALAKHCTPATPGWDVLGGLFDRARCHGLAREAGLRTPAFHQPADRRALAALLPELDLDARHYLIKTDVIDAPADPHTGRHTRVAGPDAASLAARWQESAARAATPPLLEEVVPGESDACIGVTLVADRSHAPVLAYAVRRLKLQTYSRGGTFQHPYELGANVFCETVRDDEALEAAVRFARHVGWVGALTVEFRRDSRDGSLVFLKADPRPVRSTSLSTRLGCDVPRATWRVFAGLPPEPAPPVNAGVAWLWVSACWEILRAGSAADRRQLRGLLRRLRRVRAFAYLDARDPLPFLRDATRLLPERPARWARRRLRTLHQRRAPIQRGAS